MRKVLFRVGIILAPLAIASQCLAQHHHPPQDADIHEKFYRTWRISAHDWSCCNNQDCYPTEVRIVGGEIFAKRREDGKFIAVPPANVERKRKSPDGRNHLCAPPPLSRHPPDTVFCFVLGTGM